MAAHRSRIVGALAIAALGLSATPVVAQSPAAPAEGLAGTSWAVSTVAGAPSSGATLVFADDLAGGFAGCNSFRSPYEAADGSLSFGAVATTLKACDEAIMAFEQSYLAALDSVASYSVADGALALADASGAEVLTFQAQAPASLEGEWEITGYLTGSGETAAVVSPIVDSGATLTFGPDGIVSGTAGCNQFSGGFGVEDANITIGPLMSTMMACSDELMAQEVGVMQALEGAATWSVTGSTAELRGETDLIQITLARLAPTPAAS
jgi:heat shock protein HslJ